MYDPFPGYKHPRMTWSDFLRCAVIYNWRRLRGMGREFPEVAGMNYRAYVRRYRYVRLPWAK